MSFDWQTEEEIVWDDIPPVEEAPQPSGDKRQRRRRLLLIVSLVLVLGLTAVWVVYRQVNRRIEDVAVEAEVEIFSSYSIIQQAAVERDVELFVTFLSGRDADWALAQEVVVGQGVFVDRQGLGLRWLPDQVPEEAVVDVTLSPDLNAAELVANHRYVIEIGNGLTETITLQQSAVYRRGPNRWLFAPPEPEFWGENGRWVSNLLVVSYPTRDRAIVQRLTLDLEQKLRELCQIVGESGCLVQWPLEFTTDPKALTRAASFMGLVAEETAEDAIVLPTPSLVGVPEAGDEMGYQALYRGYASLFLATVMQALTEWRCCEQGLVYQALTVAQLQQLDLSLRPLTADVYERLAQMETRLADLGDYWQMPPNGIDSEAGEQSLVPLLALIDFMTTDVGVSVHQMQRALERPESDSFEGWLIYLAIDQYPVWADLERGWRRFMVAQGVASVPPIEFPAQEIQAVCQSWQEENLLLFQVDVDANFRLDHRAGGEAIAMISLPDDDGVILAELGESPKLFLWQNGRKVRLQGGTTLFPLMFDPSGEALLLNEPEDGQPSYGLLPVAACRDQSLCLIQYLGGFPVWSPSGEHAIFVVNEVSAEAEEGSLLFLGGGRDQEADILGRGRAPFWFDEETFGYVAFVPGERPQVVRTTTTDAAIDSLFSLDDLILAAPTTPGSGMRIDYVAVSPADPDLLLVATVDPLTSGHLFTYHRETGDIRVALTFATESAAEYERGYRFSPDGRWLMMTRFQADDNAWMIYLYDVVDGAQVTIPVQAEQQTPLHSLIDWSADGRWLSVVEAGMVRLIAAGYDYERELVPQQGACTTAVWVNP